MRIVNLAHGNFYMAGAYAFLVFFEQAKLPYGVALLLSIIFIGGLGMLTEAKLYRPLGGKIEPSIVCMSGMLLVLEGMAILIFGSDIRGILLCWQERSPLARRSSVWEGFQQPLWHY